MFLPLAACHGWSVNVKVLREWRAWVSLCACVNYTCTASALSAAASKRNNFFSTVDHVDCRMLGRTSLQHGMVFHEDADPKMIGHQRSSTHGPALFRRKFSTSKKVWHNVPRRSQSAHPRQGNHTDARQTQAPSKLSLEKVPKKNSNTPCTERQRRLRTSPQWQSPARSSKSQNSRRAARNWWPWGPPWNQLSLVDQVPNYPKKNMNYSIKNQLRLKQGSKTPSDKNDYARTTLLQTHFRTPSSSIATFVHGSFATTEGPEDSRPLR